jgi:transposase
MDDTLGRHFFLQPSCDSQRLYEALRAVFVDGCRQKDVAERFGLGFDAFRQQVQQFRSACSAGQTPPFLPTGPAVDPRERLNEKPASRNARPSRTAAC